MNGKPRLACVNVPYPLSKTPVDVLTALDVYARMKGNDLAGRWAWKATIANGLRLGRPDVFSNLRHYLQAQSQGHHTIDHLGEGGMERGSARRSSLKGRWRAIVHQTQNWNCFRGNFGEASERRMERIWAFLIAQISSWTELDWPISNITKLHWTPVSHSSLSGYGF